ncbi:hypothetical protein HW555_000014 [Spodoptera exigua]|uniref:Muskelin N-terminal domain-containing protein n=1 Tax=Spodoptera exigua TaxID=7107 RepID=A0A835GV15_SPOEX|nr:hypothetical protein HW555_000014 [Spodoptera exigua]
MRTYPSSTLHHGCMGILSGTRGSKARMALARPRRPKDLAFATNSRYSFRPIPKILTISSSKIGHCVIALLQLNEECHHLHIALLPHKQRRFGRVAFGFRFHKVLCSKPNGKMYPELQTIYLLVHQLDVTNHPPLLPSCRTNIMVNNPTDQLSRWFTDSNSPSQYIMLKLKSPSIVESIKFGKYIKAHVSDLKKFQIYGGAEENNLSLLLTAGLKKDSTSEVFRLRCRTAEGLFLPIQYLKIVPLQSWGPAYNYTIWYVELNGKNQEQIISNAMETINLLEGPLQSKLWNALVEKGDFKQAEELFDQAIAEGELDWYLSWQPYSPHWRQMSACSTQVEDRLWSGEAPPPPPARQHDLLCADRDPRPDTAEAPVNGAEQSEACESACAGSLAYNKPGPRGGHQLVVDSTTGTLYLFGGWNGSEDLDDLWSFCTTSERWTLLCKHSGEVGGPSPRSCHKMVFDAVNRRLYTLGRYLDNAQRVPTNMNSDLYMYDIASGEWSLVCSDTSVVGGPRLVFDHQMCIDADTQTIYVFGGRVLPANTEEVVSPQYSGLFAYYIATNTWQLVLSDRHELNAPQARVSHSMLFHPFKKVQRRLYMFAGQRNKEQLVDLWWWDVASGQCGALCRGAVAPPPPQAGFTQRATLDPDTDELFVLSGMSKEKDKRVYNSLWVFSLRRLTWSCVYRNDSVAPNEPRPRFAHQLVYDPVKKIHYLFGGNPGNQGSPRVRLDDLWALRLRRPTLGGVRQSVLGADEPYPEPTQPFEEIKEPTPDTWDVGPDDEDPSEQEETAEWNARAQRMKLYDWLCRFFRPSTVPPKGDITDMVIL